MILADSDEIFLNERADGGLADAATPRIIGRPMPGAISPLAATAGVETSTQIGPLCLARYDCFPA